jgi:hypothetical protein
MRVDLNVSADRTQAVARALEHAYGDCASTYAEVRAEAARKRGASQASEQWKDVEQSIDPDTDSDDSE